MNLKALGSALAAAVFLSACASGPQNSQSGSPVVPLSQRAGSAAALAPGNILGCYGNFSVQVNPCPVKLTKKNGGNVAEAVSGQGVALAAIIASDCVGYGSVCNIAQTGYLQFDTTSIRGKNTCGTAYVVFEGVTASGSPIGTATLKVVNRYC